MAQIDATIPLGIRPLQLRDPLEQYANVLAAQSAQQANQFNALKMRAAEEDRAAALADDAAMREYLRMGGGESNLNALRERPRAYMAEQKRLLDTQKEKVGIGKTQADTQRTEFQTRADQFAQIAQVMRNVRDQASYDGAMQLVGNLFGADVVAKLPRQFDPATVQRMGDGALTQAQALQAEVTRRGQDMTDARTRSEGAANRAVQMRAQDMTDARERERSSIARGDAAPVTADDRSALSQRLGVPMAQRDPYAGMSPKGRETFQRDLYKQADKKLTEAEDSVSAAASMARDAQRFLQLQGQTRAQGPALGRLPAVSDAAQEMDAITAKITPQMRQPGSGATSDFDAKMFQTATVGRTKNQDTNAAIATAIIANAKNAEDRAQFMRDYLTVNGHLDGADREWKRYVNANPIFDPASPTTPRLNPKRRSYQDFFGAGTATPAVAPKASGGWTVLGVE